MVQVIFNGLIAAAITCLVGLGFGLIYRTAGFFNFSHGAIVTISPYIVYLFTERFGLPVAFTIPLAILLCVLFGMLLEIVVYRTLRHRLASSLSLMLASLGIYAILQNLISLGFGDETKRIREGSVVPGMDFFGAKITEIQVVILVVSVLLTAVLILWLEFSNPGKALRALASNPLLAEIFGLNTDRLRLWAFGIGSGLAGVTGVLIALDVDMTPTMGMDAMVLGMVAVIIGGVERLVGVVLGALALGLVLQFGVYFVGAQWQNVIAFAILFAFLVFRPQGFLGKPLRRTSV